jgi:hypothetical protein
LVWADDSIKDRAKTVDQDFGDDFVEGVTKADWSKVSVVFFTIVVYFYKI